MLLQVRVVDISCRFWVVPGFQVWLPGWFAAGASVSGESQFASMGKFGVRKRVEAEDGTTAHFRVAFCRCVL